MLDRTFLPTILQTKEELLQALRTGQLKTSKYNLLTENEKLYVELTVFGGYTGAQAIKCIEPKAKNPEALANRLATRPLVVEVIEELTIAKNKKFMAEISSARDLALNKLRYIMCTTSDAVLAASCAKTILDKAEAVLKNPEVKDDIISGYTIKIETVNNYVGKNPSAKEEPIVIPITDTEHEAILEEKKQEVAELDSSINEAKKELAKLGKDTTPINPDTGLPYTLVYESIDNYSEKN